MQVRRTTNNQKGANRTQQRAKPKSNIESFVELLNQVAVESGEDVECSYSRSLKLLRIVSKCELLAPIRPTIQKIYGLFKKQSAVSYEVNMFPMDPYTVTSNLINSTLYKMAKDSGLLSKCKVPIKNLKAACGTHIRGFVKSTQYAKLASLYASVGTMGLNILVDDILQETLKYLGLDYESNYFLYTLMTIGATLMAPYISYVIVCAAGIVAGTTGVAIVLGVGVVYTIYTLFNWFC